MKDVSIAVTKNVANSRAGDEINTLLSDLSNQVQAIAEKIDPVLAQKMGKNVKKISEEVTEAQPDQAWYELSLKGITDAALAVGAIADPIIATVKKLALLLLGT